MARRIKQLPVGTPAQATDAFVIERASGTNYYVLANEFATAAQGVTADSAALAAAASAAAASAAQATATAAMPKAGGTFTGDAIAFSSAPPTALSIVPRSYVDALEQSIGVKRVSFASTANLTLSGSQTVDGAVRTSGRCLVKNQTLPAQNGLYDVNSSGAWTRTTDADAWAELVGSLVTVSLGTTNAATVWQASGTADDGGTLGVTSVTFTQSAGGSVGGGAFVPTAGGTMTGNLIVNNAGVRINKQSGAQYGLQLHHGTGGVANGRHFGMFTNADLTAIYIDDGCHFYSCASMTISGTRVGVEPSVSFTPPITGPYMLGLKGDVVGPIFVVRPSDNGAWNIQSMDRAGNLVWSSEENGDQTWGASNTGALIAADHAASRVARDAGLGREAPRILRVTNGAASPLYGDIKARNHIVSGGVMQHGSYVVASLPAAGGTTAPAGSAAYASNGRKSGEGAAAGTGIPVWCDGTNWRTYYDNSVAAA